MQIWANIYDYANYRKFLDDYQKARYAEDKTFSKNRICRRLGLPNTKSYFRDVLAGKDITPAFIERFITAFELDKEEAQFFKVLVQFNQSANEQERELYFDQLISLNKTPSRFIDTKTYAYYKEWRHPAVRAALDVLDIKDEYRSLGTKFIPPITAKKVQQSIELLANLGLIKRNKSGFWKSTDKNLSAGFCAGNEIIKQYQLNRIEMGKQALLQAPPQVHRTFTMTLSMSTEIMEKLMERLQKLKSEIRSMVHKDTRPAEHVYQLNLQLFPQIKSKKKGA
jgi:uncharacterized protein (TIGR02147 family)